MGLVPVDSMILNSPFSKDSRKIMTKMPVGHKTNARPRMGTS